jgi:hypothetical protein
MARYSTFLYGDGTEYGSGEPVFPVEGLVRIPWIFEDIPTGNVYEFAINPNAATMPAIQKNVTTQYTASGKPINFEGRQSVPTISFSGTILHEAHLEAMESWAAKKNQVSLSDDLGRKYFVVITSFSATRNYNSEFPWRHEYNADAVVISWV